MAHESYRKASREDWGIDGGPMTLERINAGALLRIADATELMAKEHATLIRLRTYWEAEAQRRGERIHHLERSNAALRGHLSKAKRTIRRLCLIEAQRKE